MEEKYLVHYGVLGMKWGVRKKRPSSKKSSSKKKGIIETLKNRQAQKKKAKITKAREQKRVEKHANDDKKLIRSMTDAELDKYIARLQKEKLAKNLRRDTMSTGRKMIGDIVQQSAKKVGQDAAYQIGMYVVGKTVNKKAGAEVIKLNKKDDEKKKDKKAA